MSIIEKIKKEVNLFLPWYGITLILMGIKYGLGNTYYVGMVLLSGLFFGFFMYLGWSMIKGDKNILDVLKPLLEMKLFDKTKKNQ